MWEEAGKDLAVAIGVYMFCLERDGRLKPWYVGMTVAKGGFESEAFQPHKLGIYNECITAHNGKPMLFLFPLMSSSWERFSIARRTGRKSIEWLERTVMGMAYAQNEQLSNVRDMGFLKNVEVLGLIGPRSPGRPHREVKRIRQALLGEKIRIKEMREEGFLSTLPLTDRWFESPGPASRTTHAATPPL